MAASLSPDCRQIFSFVAFPKKRVARLKRIALLKDTPATLIFMSRLIV
jgi:hypothetical protein